jgi:hypothetical protein
MSQTSCLDACRCAAYLTDHNYKQLQCYRWFTHSTVHYNTHEVFSVCSVFTGCLVTDSNAMPSSASVSLLASDSRPDRFTPGTHWIGDWVGPRAGVDAADKSLLPLPRIETSAVQPVARRYGITFSFIYSRILIHSCSVSVVSIGIVWWIGNWNYSHFIAGSGFTQPEL